MFRSFSLRDSSRAGRTSLSNRSLMGLPAFVLAAVLSACDSAPLTPAEAAGLEAPGQGPSLSVASNTQLVLSATSVQLDRGDTVRVFASLVEGGKIVASTEPGHPKPIKPYWRQSDGRVVSMIYRGVIYGKSAGEIVIDVSLGNLVVRLPVRVNDGARLAVGRVSITPAAAAAVSSGGTTQLSAVVYAKNGSAIERAVTWQSHDPTIAQVDGTGKVRSLAEGKARISAVSSGVADTIIVSVGAPAQVSPPVNPGNQGPQSQYVVPASISSNCSVDVTQALLKWIAAVPDKSTLVFAKGGCYSINGGLNFIKRHGLTIEGNGATFRIAPSGAPKLSHWNFRESSNITIRNMTLIGGNSNGGVAGPYIGSIQSQHGLEFRLSEKLLIENVHISQVWSDCVYVGGGENVAQATRDVVIRGLRCERTGRHAVGLTNSERVLIENSYMGNIRWSAIDIEPGGDMLLGRDITIRGNRFGKVRHALVGNKGKGAWPNVGRITFTKNEQVEPGYGCTEPIYFVYSVAGKYRGEYTITDNQFRPACLSVVKLAQVRDVTITGNRVDISDPRGRSAVVNLRDAHNVKLTDNARGSRPLVAVVDKLSTGVTQDK